MAFPLCRDYNQAILSLTDRVVDLYDAYTDKVTPYFIKSTFMIHNFILVEILTIGTSEKCVKR